MSDPASLIQSGVAAETTEDERTMAAVCHAVAGVFGVALIGLAVPAVIWMAYQERSKYVRFHAIQALVFQIVAAVGVWALGILTCGLGLVLVFAPMAVQLYWAWLAYQGSWKPYPMLEKIGT